MTGKPTLKQEILNPTPTRQLIHQLEISNGRKAKRLLKAGETSPEGEVYGWIMVIEDVTFTAITDFSLICNEGDDPTTVLAGIEFYSGTELPGYFADITIETGTILCFTNVPQLRI